jgi:CubicO group peptidase (beta-lactamase class C family)
MSARLMPATLLACAAALAPSSQAQELDLLSLIAAMPAGTGYAAWDLCSRSLAAGDDFNHVKETYTAPKVQPLPWLWTVSRTSTRASVSALLLAPRSAVHRPGLGCTLLTPDVSEWWLRAQYFQPATSPAADGRAWPLGEGAAQPGLLSAARRAALEAGAAQVFSEAGSDPLKRTNSNALLVAQDGRLVYERYASRYQRNQPQLGWSMTKTLTSLIAGVMEREGRLKLDQPVGLAGWTGTDKAGITWRQLLNMAPGIRWNEGDYSATATDTTQMLFSEPDQCAWAAARPLESTPGTVFNYSTGFANLAMCGLKRLAGGTHQSIYNYYQTRLFAPLGIRGGVIEPDAAGTPVGGARGMLRPVDWLRLGQLVANDGQWQGKAILDPGYVAFMKAPSPASDEYGGTIWRQPTHHIPEDLRAQLPADMVFFAGVQEQLMVIVPSRRLVVLRMGVAFDTDRARRQVFQLVIDLLANP